MRSKIDIVVTKQKIKVIITMIMVVLIALILEILALSIMNQRSANRTATVLLDQVTSLIEENEKEEKIMVDDLKQEYIVKAKTVAYILDAHPEAESDINELLKIAGMMNIDEIHLFNKNGTIYCGTEPKYYGLSFNSGEQMAFFKPMLEDKSMAMCQDVTPNTGAGRNMMYAIAWNEDGDKMVQVGIEPVRLLEELKSNEISEVVENMPTYDGLNIYVTDIDTGYIVGATDKNVVEMIFDKICTNTRREEQNGDITSSVVTINGINYYCKSRNVGGYKVVATAIVKNNFSATFVAILLGFIYLSIAGSVVVVMFFRILNADKEKQETLNTLVSMSDIYYSMHLMDLENNTSTEYNAQNEIKELMVDGGNAYINMKTVIEAVAEPEFLESTLEFTDLRTISERMKGKKILSYEFVGKRLGWVLAAFITIEADNDGKPIKVMFTSRSIDDEKKKEEILISKSNTDELTGFLNRRAYEESIIEHNNVVAEDDYVYISLDVNGLKVVNDTLGHAAGDELLQGACGCMQRCLGSYGGLFRTGGDEFVAMILADEASLERILQDFMDETTKWKGKLVNSLTISFGYVTKREFPEATVREMAILADKRMYEAKSQYYQKNGVDRRGQKEAHTALCDLYTKILKVDITRDAYQIISMDTTEQTEEKGFSEKISAWLTNFGLSGQVHPDDLEEYLAKTNLNYIRNYFKRHKNSLPIFYRRKEISGYKKYMMEIIPTSNYTDDNQELFLYVKKIDK